MPHISHGEWRSKSDTFLGAEPSSVGLTEKYINTYFHKFSANS